MGILGVFLFLLETSWTASLHFEHGFACNLILEVGSKVKNIKGFFNATLRVSNAFQKSRATSAPDLLLFFFFLSLSVFFFFFLGGGGGVVAAAVVFVTVFC